MNIETTSQHRVAGGTLHFCRHASVSTGTTMRFSLFLPVGPGPHPLLLWLSGLTCTEENFSTKSGAYAAAVRFGLAVLAPDTSPRGDGVPDDPAWDLGQGASFYLDAVREPWSRHFRMESWITTELPEVVRGGFALAADRCGISGHSMGGHGALTLALRHPALYRSVSAFAPISSPTRCPWGVKAFSAYLGDEQSEWARHDAARLLEGGAARGRYDSILVDQGAADAFLAEQLRPELLEQACDAAGQPLVMRRQPGYDHSYYFVSTFIADHLAWHAERLA